MNNIIIKSVKNLKNDLPNYTKERSDKEKTLNYKVQNIETEKMEILDKIGVYFRMSFSNSDKKAIFLEKLIVMLH